VLLSKQSSHQRRSETKTAKSSVGFGFILHIFILPAAFTSVYIVDWTADSNMPSSFLSKKKSRRKSAGSDADSEIYDLPLFEECLFGPTGIRPSVAPPSVANTSANGSANASPAKPTPDTKTASKPKSSRGGPSLANFLESGGIIDKPADDEEHEPDSVQDESDTDGHGSEDLPSTTTKPNSSLNEPATTSISDANIGIGGSSDRKPDATTSMTTTATNEQPYDATAELQSQPRNRDADSSDENNPDDQLFPTESASAPPVIQPANSAASSNFSEILHLDIPPVQQSNSQDSTENKHNKDIDDILNNSNAFDDDIAAGHWGEVAKTIPDTPVVLNKHYFADDYDPNDHTINLTQLRALCTQGIPDEGSFRAMAWRVLLGLVPYRKIHSTWGKCLHGQRVMYRELCHEYFCNPIDGGRHLRGTWTKKLRNATKKQRQKYVHSIQRLDEDDQDGASADRGRDEHGAPYDDSNLTDDDYDDGDDGIIAGGNSNSKTSSDDDDDDDLQSVGTHQTEHTMQQQNSKNKNKKSYSYYRSIEEQLAPKLRSQWNKTGLSSSLDANSVVKPFASTLPASATKSTSPRRRRRRTNEREKLTPNNDSSNEQNGNNKNNNLTDNTVPLKKSTLRGLSQNQLAVPKALQRNETATPSAMADFLMQAKSLASIRKDTVRTHPDLYFFLEPDQNLGLRRYAALERILFIWAKLNKGVCYVQGMNEIVGTLFYVLANDVNADWAKHAEADTYWLFDILMRELRDIYMPDKDHDDDGIHARLDDIEMLLSKHDPQLQQHLQKLGINTSLYAVRWVTTLLSREFLLPDTIRLWDSIFSSTNMEGFLRYVCVTMIVMVRDDLLKGDFSQCLQLLHDYPSQNVDQLLESSQALESYEMMIFNVCKNPSKHVPASFNQKYRPGGTLALHQALQVVEPPYSIVMAFGFPQNVLYRAYQDSVTAARNSQMANASSNAAASGGSSGLLGFGLAGKAKRLWSGWKDSVATTDHNVSTVEKSPREASLTNNDPGSPQLQTEDGAVPLPPPSRHWHRGTSAPVRMTKDNPAASENVTAKPDNGVAESSAPSTGSARSRFWNRGRSNSANTPSTSAVIDSAASVTVDEKMTGRILNPDLMRASEKMNADGATSGYMAEDDSIGASTGNRIWGRNRTSSQNSNASSNNASASMTIPENEASFDELSSNSAKMEASGVVGRTAPKSRLWNRRKNTPLDATAQPLPPITSSAPSASEITSLSSLSNLPAEVSERVSRDIFEILSS